MYGPRIVSHHHTSTASGNRFKEASIIIDVRDTTRAKGSHWKFSVPSYSITDSIALEYQFQAILHGLGTRVFGYCMPGRAIQGNSYSV
jgi:hypothetical protein